MCKNIQLEPESTEYGACTFTINNLRAQFRVAKTTPTKVGQFVTFWKRSKTGPIEPYSIHDPFDILIVSVRQNNHFGQFIFPKSILVKKGLVSKEDKDGKRAMRVYAPWVITTSKQAQKTQKWQVLYFFEINQSDVETKKMLELLKNSQ